MEDGIFNEIIPEPPAELVKNILLRIEREEHRRLAMNTAAFGAVLLGSLVLAGYGWMAAAGEASRSGLLSFISLFLSDFSVATANLSDFMLSVVESFPVFPVALFLSGIFFAIWSAARFVREIVLTRTHVFSAFS